MKKIGRGKEKARVRKSKLINERNPRKEGKEKERTH